MNNDALMPMGDEHTTRQQVPLDPNQPLKLSVTNSSGDVSITAGDRSDVLIIAERSNSRRADDDDRIEIDVDGNTISVHPNWQIGNSFGEIARKVKHQLKEGFNSEEWDLKKMKLGVNTHFDIRIELPREIGAGSSVSVKSASGDITAADISARVSAATAKGDVQLERLRGKVSAHSASGDLTITTVTGSIEANTANGDITVTGGEAWTALRAVNGDIQISDMIMKNARITTVSGDISANASMNNAAQYTFDTVSGDITLNSVLPATGASLNFKAVSGSVKVGGEWVSASGKRSWKLEAGAEGPELRVKAVSGDLKASASTEPSVNLMHETPPHETAKEAEHIGGEGAPVDFDWDKARSWVSSVTQKISQVVNDMDEAGDRRRAADQHAASTETEPMPPHPAERPVPPVPPVSPVSPMSHVGHHANEAATEPVDMPPFSSDTHPIPPHERVMPETAPIEPEETSSQRRLRLLEAVQRGEMTVDEALSQLDGDSTDH